MTEGSIDRKKESPGTQAAMFVAAHQIYLRSSNLKPLSAKETLIVAEQVSEDIKNHYQPEISFKDLWMYIS